jgi:hypothetical protein
MIIAAVVAVAAIIIVAVVALGGGDDKKRSTATTVPDTFSLPTDPIVTEPPTTPLDTTPLDTRPLGTTPLETVPAETTTTLPPPVVIPLQAKVTWAGLTFTLDSATYSAVDHQLDVSGTIASPLATRDTSVADVFVSDEPFIAFSGSQFPGEVRDPNTLPVAATVTAGLRFRDLPDGFDPAKAKLTFGAANEHQAIVPLDGSVATSDATIALPITGTVTSVNQTTFAIQSVNIVAGSCEGSPRKTYFTGARVGKTAVVVRGTFGSTSNQPSGVGINLGSGSVTLLQPNGLSAMPTPDVVEVLGRSNPPFEDYTMCFLVDGPPVGTYTLSIPTFDENGVIGAGTFDIVIPDPNAAATTTTVVAPPVVDTTSVPPPPTNAPTTVAAP